MASEEQFSSREIEGAEGTSTPPSETDAKPTGLWLKQSVPVYEEDLDLAPDPGTTFDDENYNMRHKRRGKALIFNHCYFKALAPRNGTNKDCADLAAALRGLRFDVRINHDPSYKEISSKLDEVSCEDHTDADCLLVAVLSHGDPGILYARDTAYKVNDLWQRFTADKCRTLAGKPKIFIIQACRGEAVDSGVRVRTQTDSAGSHYTIPAQSDILIAYSTVESHYSWRSPRDGSWFIQALVQELKINGKRRDLQTILTFVCRRVALEKLSYVPGNPDMDLKKQTPAFISMLTRLIYFTDYHK